MSMIMIIILGAICVFGIIRIVNYNNNSNSIPIEKKQSPEIQNLLLQLDEFEQKILNNTFDWKDDKKYKEEMNFSMYRNNAVYNKRCIAFEEKLNEYKEKNYNLAITNYEKTIKEVESKKWIKCFEEYFYNSIIKKYYIDNEYLLSIGTKPSKEYVNKESSTNTYEFKNMEYYEFKDDTLTIKFNNDILEIEADKENKIMVKDFYLYLLENYVEKEYETLIKSKKGNI